LAIPGTAQFLYVGRDPAVNPLGTFVTQLTDFSFSGELNGNTFDVKRNLLAGAILLGAGVASRRRRFHRDPSRQ
jgi:hypothetical protein